ncbi:MAG TPA: hypothetical protein VNO23_07510 [Candidatus Binatia bacterium]|nr:hypothetical protein [Candidatus Binatia bacterium]
MNHTALGVLLLLAVAAVWLAADRLMRHLARRTARHCHPSQLHASQLADALEEPVRLPPRCGDSPYTEVETFPTLDVYDQQLAELHDRLWPQECWYAVLVCPHPQLTGYDTHGEALEHEDGEPYECPCGRIHVRRPGRRTRRASRTRHS